MHNPPGDFYELLCIDWHELIEKSIRNVADSYYKPLEASYIADAGPVWLRENLKEALAQYTERDWCYELYHQMRLLLTSISEQYEIVKKVRLAGEPSKQATYEAVSHSQIWQENSCCKGEINDNSGKDSWTENTNCRMPDILLHDPAGVGYQVFAVEVKRAYQGGGPSQKSLADDFTALAEYITGLGYSRGFFIGVGLSENNLKDALSALECRRRRQKVLNAACRITIYLVQDGDNLFDNRRIQRMGLDSSTLALKAYE